MKKKYLLALVLLLMGGNRLFSHPHIFIVPEIKFIYQNNEIKQVRVRWLFDAMSTFQILNVFDKNRNKRLDRSEKNQIKKKYFPALRQFNYFTFLAIERKSISIQPVQFKPYLRGKQLVYEFFLIPKVKGKSLLLYFFDKTNYVAFDLRANKIKVNSLVKKKIQDNKIYLKFK